MTLVKFLLLLRRYRIVLLVALVVGVVAGWLSAPGSDAGPTEFVATHTLISNDQSRTAVNIEQAALVATKGTVVEQAAAALGEDPALVRRSISASGDEQVRAISISAKDVDRDKAAARADAVAEALKAELSGEERTAYDKEVATYRERITALEAQIAAGSDGSPTAEAALQSATAELSSARQQLGQLELAGVPEPPLETVEQARGRPADDGLTAPDSKPARAALLGAFGLLLGVGAALALDRLDTRIHSKEAAEAAFGFPVIAEIPPNCRRRPRVAATLADSSPSSHFVEAFRGFARARVAGGSATRGSGRRVRVAARSSSSTSPVAGEGKTTTSAHLSVLLGEVGRSTLLVSGDFRRPRLHDLFGRSRSPGLTEVLGSDQPTAGMGDLDLSTAYPLVQFLASGAPTTTPALVVKRVPQILRAAQPNWDFIIVDSAPLLVANDSADLAREANGVVVLARAGHTSIDAAKRSADLLRRVGAPVIGVVLVGATDSLAAYRYYYGRDYYGHDDGSDGGRRRSASAGSSSNGSSARRRLVGRSANRR